jgi:hypothetical protein
MFYYLLKICVQALGFAIGYTTEKEDEKNKELSKEVKGKLKVLFDENITNREYRPENLHVPFIIKQGPDKKNEYGYYGGKQSDVLALEDSLEEPYYWPIYFHEKHKLQENLEALEDEKCNKNTTDELMKKIKKEIKKKTTSLLLLKVQVYLGFFYIFCLY